MASAFGRLLQTGELDDGTGAASARLSRAEQQGLKIAILCRTAAIVFALTWYVTALSFSGHRLNPYGIAAVICLMLGGFGYLSIIGTRFDRWWLKYLITTIDILAVCALFAFVPPSRGTDVPQIVAFRSNGIHLLFPLVVLSSLSLSPRFVLWSGGVAAGGYLLAFSSVAADIETPLSWADLPPAATRADYERIFLSFDFVGNQIDSVLFVLMSAIIVAVAVHRARRVFFAQVAAEDERETERAARERITLTLGRYVPEAIALRLVHDASALAPQVRTGAVLVMDIVGFTAFAAGRDPAEVISTLNAFLSRCADVVATHGGVVITFTGDGILATFSTPIDIDEPEAAALAAALDLTREGKAANFGVRIGLAAGPIAAGCVGSSRRQAFTVYGDTVNRAARLEALAATLGETVVMDEEIARAADPSRLRQLGAHTLKGLTAPLTVFAATVPDLAARTSE